ncbi:MAG TPA: energy transducer TonB [Mucilaginibacter sp.]|jgi:TonB family protein|nr:energy transducer TonB [Mucilaginibacter sp.]
MKHFYVLFLASTICYCAGAQIPISKDSVMKNGEHKIFTTIEDVPEFPGGLPAFSNFISKNLKYPEVARLIGINGRVIVSFVVERDGKVNNVTPVSCVGAGCEAEAERVLEQSPTWKPGTQDGVPVRVQYSVPISFTLDGKDKKTYMRNLQNSDYGFVFSIKDTLYTLDEAQKILGRSFDPNLIKTAEPFYNYDKLPKFDMPDKKEVYLVIMKSN